MTKYPFGFVAINWTDWININDRKNEHCKAKNCIYMYATRKESLYIGTVDKCIVGSRNRSKLKKNKNATQWIKNNIKGFWGVKVGYMYYRKDKGFNYVP